MERPHFSQSDAAAKVGVRVRSLAEFTGVPVGTTGTVATYERALRGFDVAVEWHQGRAKPLPYWFNRHDYENQLEEVPA